MENRADKLLLLFSADWFAPFWGMADLDIEAVDKNALQRSLRLAVNEMLEGTKLYWHVSFNEKRLMKTRKTLTAMLNANFRNCFAQQFLRSDLDQEVRESALLASITPLLLRDIQFLRMSGLSYEEIDRLRDGWTRSIRPSEALKTAENGCSDWDRFLISLTPDLPRLLIDFAIQEFAFRKAALQFWSYLRLVPGETKSAIVQKYQGMSQELAGIFPSFGWLEETDRSMLP